MRRFAVLTALALAAPPARAHEYWLSPSTYRTHPGDTLAVAAYAGTGFRGEEKPFARARAVRLELRTRRETDLAPLAVNGDLTFARWIAEDDLGAIVVYQSSFTPIELPAAEFDAYLRLEGLDEPLRSRRALGAAAGPGRERYARCAKTWIAGRDTARLARAAGLPLELVPVTGPAAGGTAFPGKRLAVRVLYRGRPLAGALVRAWNRPLGPATAPRDPAARDSVGPAGEARSGRDGIASLAVDRPGEWLLSAVHMTPSDDRAAEWQSLWASLTFALEAPSR